MTRFTPPSEPVEPLRILDSSGALLGETAMSDAAVLEAFEWMLLTRTFDQKATSLQRQGRFGTFSSVRGQEASVVGAASALDPARDWIAPQYRELPAILRHGMPLENFALYFMGHPRGCVIPDDVNILPIQISLAAQLPQAVGVAWGLRQQGRDGVVTTFVGDGASSEGDFHESLNLAGVTKAPVVFFLQNNGWAISTPRAKQTAARTFADRAAGYGIHGAYVDGNDLLAVNAVMVEAVARARAGEGPTLVESLTWRAGAHNTADDPTKYVTDADHAAWEGTDPLARVESYLRRTGALADAGYAEIQARCVAEVDRALGVAQATPAPGAEALFDHVYAEPFARFEQQRAAWLQMQEA
ncbi:thiamine pyrophosphate-dependent dehydrogenase E1 component subunit alpha [Nocardioides nitrophenolicus]|uniref:thiamine pyrophosphate-dependent dehydrogenase E1 component subunit alpha n=1 Tax=Nocardioides nitrophenolicus TaxID=60489 RepID=UPI00195A8BEB|nr:thiamine pyrophosphate-dependent dehydrogenase E1 component subunit alpha [Nocardioides nitrophenolicus]MBM7518659.1 pyruvate dehydrogenase E1 component alpha subunit [Nocardioides nitrophenolicus]